MAFEANKRLRNENNNRFHCICWYWYWFLWKLTFSLFHVKRKLAAMNNGYKNKRRKTQLQRKTMEKRKSEPIYMLQKNSRQFKIKTKPCNWMHFNRIQKYMVARVTNNRQRSLNNRVWCVGAVSVWAVHCICMLVACENSQKKKILYS